jgi:NTE family protein
MRSATISSHTEIATSRAAADLYVMPELDMIEIRDWKSYSRAVEAGYRATSAALAAVAHPVTHLRASREARLPVPA